MTTGQSHEAVGPLPQGRYAIEASAGTGKTYALANLALRQIAENGIRIDQMLIVTFTRAAAADLRDRVRSRILDAVLALDDESSLRAAANDDEVFEAWANEIENNESRREQYRSRLKTALEAFDTAIITTIHGFVTQTLTQIGITSTENIDAVLAEDADDLVKQVVADCLIIASTTGGIALNRLPDEGALIKLVQKVIGNRGIELEPRIENAASGEAATYETETALKWRLLVDRATAEIAARKQAAGTLSFDDVLVQLRDAIANDPLTGESLRERYRVALIDEFQDTDPVQWEIFSSIFSEAAPNTALVMVGDPKQAIYGFRGADIHTYLAAINIAGTEHRNLSVNWRSDGVVLDGLNALLGQADFGDGRIKYVPVSPAPDHRSTRIRTKGTDQPGVEIRIMASEKIDDSKRMKNGSVSTDYAEKIITADLVVQTHQLLNEAEIPDRDHGEGAYRPLRPADIAVLVNTNKEAQKIQKALIESGVPAVVAKGANVLESEASEQWQELLAALLDPSDPTRARAVALTWFFGWSAAEVAATNDEQLAEVQQKLQLWETTLANHSVTEFCGQVWRDSKVEQRLLEQNLGDRHLTDLEHITELLQQSSPRDGITAAQLRRVLTTLSEENQGNRSDDDVFARRIESEAEAVQIMTIHGAKGLEFPVVLAPTLWRGRLSVSRDECIYVDPDTKVRTFDVANKCEWPSKSMAKGRMDLAKAEQAGANARLGYVALTRAKHLGIAWWSPTQNWKRSTLKPLIFPNETNLLNHDKEIMASLAPRVEASGGALSVVAPGVAERPRDKWIDPLAAPVLPELAAAIFNRELEITKERWSFSKISSRDRHGAFGAPMATDDSLGDQGAADEPRVSVDLNDRDANRLEGISAGAPATDLPLGALPKGATFGTLVHKVLDDLDFAAADVEDELRKRVDKNLRGVEEEIDKKALVAGLLAAMQSPLGPQLENKTLADIKKTDCLAEVAFELRLGDGDNPATDRDLGNLILAHMDADDPLRPWAEKLSTGLFNVDLVGHLTGSIDTVFRISGSGTTKKYVVSDYKTNGLSEPGQPMLARDYEPSRLAVEMANHHYPLQALLYSVALHRYLRSRIRDYDPKESLGGVAYLFVRGMTGPQTPITDGEPNGVFSWPLPSELVVATSDLLAGNLTTASKRSR